MPIPDFQSVMLPLLRRLSDRQEHRFRDLVEVLEDEFQLTDDERAQMLPSGRDRLFRNRVGWASTYLKRAGLCEAVRHGWQRITTRGCDLLNQQPERINIPLLRQYPEFQAARQAERDEVGPTTPGHEVEVDGATPVERLEVAYAQLRASLEQDLLRQVQTCSAAFFEQLVVDLLVKMGYGGNRQDAGRAIGRSGDGGIDGLIKEDEFGLDVIYLQAKRWEHPVGRPQIQQFAGALQGHRARKGVFVTTAQFSEHARQYASSLDSRLVLVDGRELAKLMVDHGLGVVAEGVYELKRIDTDYFAEE